MGQACQATFPPHCGSWSSTPSLTTHSLPTPARRRARGVRQARGHGAVHRGGAARRSWDRRKA